MVTDLLKTIAAVLEAKNERAYYLTEGDQSALPYFQIAHIKTAYTPAGGRRGVQKNHFEVRYQKSTDAPLTVFHEKACLLFDLLDMLQPPAGQPVKAHEMGYTIRENTLVFTVRYDGLYTKAETPSEPMGTLTLHQ